MESILQTIFLLGFAVYEQAHALPFYVRKAAWCIMHCRTAVLGGHTQACPEGHFERHWYNSCKHRMCPQCAFVQVQQWLEKQKARLLRCDHYHVIFTLPHELNAIWQWNSQQMTNILFGCARDTLMELLGDEKYLGAKPGIIATVHTWTKTLQWHPHIHCLVTGGGLGQGQWRAVRRDFLLPFAVVRDLFRGKVKAAMEVALDKGEVVLPEGLSAQRLRNLLNKLGRKKWNVKIGEKYAHGQGVLRYLARYLRGGPIANRRIVAVTEESVTFNCGREHQELLSLPLGEFIGRYVQHMAQPNAVWVRSYGLYAPSQKEELARCREVLGQAPVAAAEPLEWQQCLERCFAEGEQRPWQCPVCGRALVRQPLGHVSSVVQPFGVPPPFEGESRKAA
jgi:hypothetical protein